MARSEARGPEARPEAGEARPTSGGRALPAIAGMRRDPPVSRTRGDGQSGSENRRDLSARKRAPTGLRVTAGSDDVRRIGLAVLAGHLDVDHSQHGLVELRDEKARDTRYLVRIADARVVREKEKA